MDFAQLLTCATQEVHMNKLDAKLPTLKCLSLIFIYYVIMNQSVSID